MCRFLTSEEEYCQDVELGRIGMTLRCLWTPSGSLHGGAQAVSHTGPVTRLMGQSLQGQVSTVSKGLVKTERALPCPRQLLICPF